MKNKPKAPDDLQQVAGGAGHNTLTDDQEKVLTLSFVREYEKLIEAQKAAASALQNFGRRVKADLGKYGITKLKIALDYRKNDGASEDLKAELEAKAQMARWLGMPIGAQGDLFGPDRRTADEKAEQEGFEAGSDRTTPRKPPEKFGLTTPSAQHWYKGFDRAQQLLFDAFAQKGDPLLRIPSVADQDTEKQAEAAE